MTDKPIHIGGSTNLVPGSPVFLGDPRTALGNPRGGSSVRIHVSIPPTGTAYWSWKHVHLSMTRKNHI
eukprot:1083682-Amorphochlora_amoeboformis.AAC.1